MKIDLEHRSKFEDKCFGSLPIYNIEIVNGSHLFFKSNDGIWHIWINYDGIPTIELIEKS